MEISNRLKRLQIYLAQQLALQERQLMLVGIHILIKLVRLERRLAHNFI
jgi:hypothetical protein